jgi:UDP-2,3-diacylglucosamine pyrophosphatase LpxH
MKIEQDFIKSNDKITIVSDGGNPSPIPGEWRPVLTGCDMLVAIPDMHMYLYNSNLDNFKYGARAMLSFLDHLDTLKVELALQGKTLRIYQLGDLYEQRFPGLSGGNATATEIRMSHPDYDRIINTMDSMRTHYIYGNHDFELRHFPGFRFAALEGKVYLEHGFTADKWIDFSNPNDGLWEAGNFAFLKILQIESFFTNLLVEARMIEKDEHFALGVQSGEDPDYTYPSSRYYKKEKKKYLNYFSDRLKNHPDNPDIKICIIAHTHKPYLNTAIDHGRYMYVDAGAWTVGRSDFAVVTNEEIAVCNYQR